MVQNFVSIREAFMRVVPEWMWTECDAVGNVVKMYTNVYEYYWPLQRLALPAFAASSFLRGVLCGALLESLIHSGVDSVDAEVAHAAVVAQWADAGHAGLAVMVIKRSPPPK